MANPVSKNFEFNFFIPEQTWDPIPQRFKYLVYQYEITTTGRLHVQGFCQFACAMRVKAVEKVIGFGAHVEVCKFREQCRLYSMKEVTKVAGPFEYGTLSSGQGTRTDINKVISLPIRQVAIDYPEVFFKYHRGLVARRDWINSVPEMKPWEVYYRDFTKTGYPENAYFIRLETKEVDRDIIRIPHWDYYDYEEIAVCDFRIDWEPFVRSIYRGMIKNNVKTLYVSFRDTVTSVTSCVGNTSTQLEVPEDNLELPTEDVMRDILKKFS